MLHHVRQRLLSTKVNVYDMYGTILATMSVKSHEHENNPLHINNEQKLFAWR